MPSTVGIADPKRNNNIMPSAQTPSSEAFANYDADIGALKAAKDTWAQSSVETRIALLQEIKDNLIGVAQDWVDTAARKKQIPEGAHLVGEEWTTGPYSIMSACNGLIKTLSGMEGKTFLKDLSTRTLTTGQLAVKIMPSSIWDRVLMSGIQAEIWMKPGVTRANLPDHTASAYDTPAATRQGKIALVLGAGNIASIAPLDAFQKLFLENQVVLLKMNPVNDYLTDYLCTALKPLIDMDALRIVKDTETRSGGPYLVNHRDIEEIHITGAAATHDAIIWGTGETGVANKAANTPINTRRITSELGAVCPTIVVPGPWSDEDLQFQAEHIATQKMHNSGFNCVACQALILPKSWNKTEQLMQNLQEVIKTMSPRLGYYPGAKERQEEFASHAKTATRIDRGPAPDLVLANIDDDPWFTQTEVFAPALGTHRINEANPAAYLRAAIKYANETLHGTLGANILIHPKTIKSIGKTQFEKIIAELHYGTIAINAWTGLAFSLAQCPWGAFPGHTLDDVQSGIGFVHNTYMFDSIERTVIRAPFQPFPRNLRSGGFTMLPKPPWFITNKNQGKMGPALTDFQYKPEWGKIPKIIKNALKK